MGIAVGHAHAQQAALAGRASSIQRSSTAKHVLQRHGEGDARVVKLGAGQLIGFVGAWSLRRHGHEHAQHAAAKVDERAAVVGGRRVGVGLQRAAVHAIERTDDADRDVEPLGVVGAADGDRPVADVNVGQRRRLGRRQRLVDVDLQQHEHAIRVAADQSRPAAARPPGSRTRIDAGCWAKLNALETI